ncbi:hypothetical protein NliqN6_2710 [Naganishia liquefaciens]|uniref:Uncharacterized protein n=1 Tax=Naganishia liquefaciens TaxID=104408 RepID=A0A8H3TSH2_9TREE|nr:hypothetical protein NliqN6_2710 [Naganishia liquefaciens]
MTSPINNSISYASPPPAYSVVAPSPRYTPKKDFRKAFGDLQGQYGFDGGAPILLSKDEKAKSVSKKHNRCFMKAVKSFFTGPSNASTEKAKLPAHAKLTRIPSPARRIIESGPTLSYAGTASALTYPLRPVSPASISSTASSHTQAKPKAQKRSKAADNRGSAERGNAIGLYDLDTGFSGRSSGA